GEFGEPAFFVDGEEGFHVVVGDGEAGAVDGVGGGDFADGGIDGAGGAVAAFKDPFEDAGIFAVAGPEEFALVVFSEPVDVENVGHAAAAGDSHFEPVGKVIAHVVAAERKHGHGIPPEVSDGAGGSGGGFAGHGGAEEGAVLPTEGFVDQRN